MGYKHSTAFTDFVEDLREGFDRNTVGTALLPIVRDRFGKKAEISQVMVKHVRNCVFACRVLISTADKEPDMVWPVVAKSFLRKEDLGHSFSLMQLLWQNGFSHDAEDGISMAEPLLLAPDINFLFMGVVPGTKLRKFIKRSGNNTEYMRRFARTLAKLHQCQFIPERERTLQGEHRRKEREYFELVEAFPKLRESIRFIVETSQDIASEFGTDIYVPVHTDYNLGHVHVDGERSWLIDYDDIKHGDPAWDLGKVLTFSVLNNEKPSVTNGEELREAFKEEYFSIMDKAIAYRVPLYESFYLLTRACNCCHSQEASRLAKVENLIKRAVACIERMSSNTVK